MKSYFQTFHATVGGRFFDCECRIYPPRKAPHAGADSPAFMAPGSAGFVRILAILVAGVWQDPADMRADTLAALQVECERKAGVHSSAVLTHDSQLAFDPEVLR